MIMGVSISKLLIVIICVLILAYCTGCMRITPERCDAFLRSCPLEAPK